MQCPQSFHAIVNRQLHELESQDTVLQSAINDAITNFSQCTFALLMYNLNAQLKLAKKSLLEAAASAPLYGILTCLRSILNHVKGL